jgi:glycosyltransferase involved in cell wall biosynthesis
MSAFDLYVSGSVDEGFPNAIGEAMACGVPCVVTDVGESAGLVGDTGWTVAPRQPAALRDAIAAALAEGSPALRRRGASARQRIVDHWSLGSVISQYQDLYEEMVAEARQRRRS